MKRQRGTYVNKPYKKPRTNQPIVTSGTARNAAYQPGAVVVSAGNSYTNIIAKKAPRGGEVKSCDVAGTAISISTAIGLQLLNGVAEGVGVFQRIGRKMQMKSVHIRGVITPTGTNAAAVAITMARVIVFYDRQTNGAAPVLGDLLQGIDYQAATFSTVFSGINMNNRDRFVVLMDDQILLPPCGINGASAASTVLNGVDPNSEQTQGSININRYIKLKGADVIFSGTSGTVAGIASGSLYIATISNDPGGTPAYQLNVGARLRYYD